MKHPHTLSGLSFLNTRPSHQARALTQLLEQRGGRVFHFPVFDIQPITFALSDVKKIDHCIFLSSNAVYHFFHQCSPIFILPKSIIAIGSATQRALHQRGITAITPVIFNSENILELPVLQRVYHQHILIVCGENSKSLLQKTLAQRGAHANTLVCYRRVLISHHMTQEFPQLLQANIQCVISTSVESFQALMKCFDHNVHLNWLLQRKICVIHDDMKKQAKSIGFQKVIQANDPTSASIVSAIEKNILLNER